MPNVVETPVRRGRPPSARSRDAALTATVELLAEVGYGRLTTAAVAMRAGVSTATLYRHWESKDALVTDAVSGLVAEIRIPDEGGVRGDLLSLMRDAVRLYTTSVAAPALRGVTSEMSNNPALRTAIRERVVETRRSALREVLQRGVARRRADPGDRLRARPRPARRPALLPLPDHRGPNPTSRSRRGSSMSSWPAGPPRPTRGPATLQAEVTT